MWLNVKKVRVFKILYSDKILKKYSEHYPQVCGAYIDRRIAAVRGQGPDWRGRAVKLGGPQQFRGRSREVFGQLFYEKILKKHLFNTNRRVYDLRVNLLKLKMSVLRPVEILKHETGRPSAMSGADRFSPRPARFSGARVSCDRPRPTKYFVQRRRRRGHERKTTGGDQIEGDRAHRRRCGGGDLVQPRRRLQNRFRYCSPLVLYIYAHTKTRRRRRRVILGQHIRIVSVMFAAGRCCAEAAVAACAIRAGDGNVAAAEEDPRAIVRRWPRGQEGLATTRVPRWRTGEGAEIIYGRLMTKIFSTFYRYRGFVGETRPAKNSWWTGGEEYIIITRYICNY